MSFAVNFRLDRQPLEGLKLPDYDDNGKWEEVQAYRYVLIASGIPAIDAIEVYMTDTQALKMLLKKWLGVR